MAYNVPNWGFIAAGQTINVCYLFDGGQDLGAQFAEGKPENPGGGYLRSSNHQIFFNGSQIVYCFQLTNLGEDTTFMLCGGGLT